MAWTVSGNIRGPQGPKGDQGPTGPAGTGIAIAGSVANYAALPTNLTPADAGDGYINEADGKLYIWSGTSFPPDGSGVEFRGPEGPQGVQGPQGIQGLQGPQGEQGPEGAAGADGATGATGAKGDPGATGTRGSRWYTGTGAPGTIAGAIVGDMYLDTTDGMVYQLG